MAGKGLAARGGGGGAPPVQTGGLLREEEREDAETFGERHTDDGLDEDLAGRAGVAADGFGGLLADETDADGAAEETEGAGDVTSEFSEDRIHVVDLVVVAVAAVRTRGTLPAVKS